MQFGAVTISEPLPTPPPGGRLPHWKELAQLSEDALRLFNIAAVQIVTQMGLPGSERLNYHGCMNKLGVWADHVEAYTNYCLPQFWRAPEQYENSEAYFRAMCLATVLQKKFGVKYDPAKIPRDVPFEVEDKTVQGVLFGNGGTCASLPVLYAAIGRKLGYPIKLATVFVDREVLHCIARWEDEKARFNIETTGIGLATPTDDEYRTGKYQGTPKLERQGRFLESKTPRMELAGFLQERARTCRRYGMWLWMLEAFAWAFALDTTNVVSEDYLRLALNERNGSVKARMPIGFPELSVLCPFRQFPDMLPLFYEREITALMWVERLLNAPELQHTWEQMRRGEWKGCGANRAIIDYKSDGSSQMVLELNS